MVRFAELAPWWTGIISPSADMEQLSALIAFKPLHIKLGVGKNSAKLSSYMSCLQIQSCVWSGPTDCVLFAAS